MADPSVATGRLPDWPNRWRGRWIWDQRPDESYWWRHVDATPHFTYLRTTFDLTETPAELWIRVTCDSRYVLSVNGSLVGRGPVRGEPEHLGWDEHDLAAHVAEGRNVIVALCHFYGVAGPWWIPASPLGTLGHGSFCLESAPGAPADIRTDDSWKAVRTPWIPNDRRGIHSVPPEVIDGRLEPIGLHDPDADDGSWADAIVLSGRGHGTVLDRPPAAPYMSPLRRPIPQLRSVIRDPALRDRRTVSAVVSDDPLETWWTVVTEPGGSRIMTVWDVGGIVLGHVRMKVTAAAPDGHGTVVDVAVGEDLNDQQIPEIRPRNWVARSIVGDANRADITFFDPVGFRFIAVHHPPGVEVEVEVEETTYPRTPGAALETSDRHLSELWAAGLRTLDVCSTDAFLDCPGREQRAWVADAYPQVLVSLVTNPDTRLVRHHLALTARSRLASGLLAGAGGCDFARIGFTMPEYSLHWTRTLAAYWLHTGDESFVRDHLSVVEGFIERYESQRGPSGLLEEFPGWVFIDWAQVERDVVTGVHDALYVAALRAYSGLPGASDVSGLIERSTSAFEALWDGGRGMYVDVIGPDGPGRRMSQHTNGMALLAGLVPEERVGGVMERMVDPAKIAPGGRIVLTPTPGDWRDKPDAHDWIPIYQYLEPDDLDPERDVVGAQPWFFRFIHEAWASHDRRDLVIESLRRWKLQPGHGTLGEFWDAGPGAASRCHGWAASPTYDLVAFVLGVQPTEPGFGRAVVDPYLGDLDLVRGSVATPHGWLGVTVDAATVDVEVPDGITLSVNGEEFGPGAHRVDRS